MTKIIKPPKPKITPVAFSGLVPPQGWRIVEVIKEAGRKFIHMVCDCGDTKLSCRSENLKSLKPFCKYCSVLITGHKWIPEKVGIYSISENGEIYSYKARKFLSERKGSGVVNLSGDQFYIHKLVGLVFNNISLESDICFVDGDSCNRNFRNIKKKTSIHLDRIGNKYGRLLVESMAASEGKSAFKCKCDCGREHIGDASDIANGHTLSCGCLKVEAVIKRNTTHNKAKTPTYKCWMAAKSRCSNVKSRCYHDYGGRGITVCDRWLEPDGKGFLNFLEDMGEKPKGLTLDRIDPNGNYEPNNCRWETYSMQTFNRRRISTNTSGRTGVFKCRNKWRVLMSNRHIGVYSTFEEASEVRSKLELDMLGFDKGVGSYA